MAEFYFDHSAIGNEYEAYADTPTTWAVPQDGNGKAGPGHAAAVAIATVDVAGCTASGTGTIGVLGVTVSSTLNATGAALATAIASAINAASGAVSSTYSALLLPLNRLVYARVDPGLSTRVQIMMRIAGTDWVGFSPTQANISPAATISNFAGGANGPFSYFVNNTTVFGKTQGTYGIAVVAPASVTNPASATDVIHGRTKRSAANLSVTITSSSAFGIYWQSRNFLFDNGTVWSGDNGKFTFTHKNTQSGVNTHSYFMPQGGGSLCFESRGVDNFELQGAATGSSGSIVMFGRMFDSNSRMAFIRSRFVEGSDNTVGNRISIFGDDGSSYASLSVDLSGSYVEYRSTAKTLINCSGSGVPGNKIKLNGLRVSVEAATGAIGSFIRCEGSGTAHQIEWIGGSVSDSNGVFKCVNPISVTTSQTSTDILIDSVVGVTDPSVGWSASRTSSSRMAWNSPEGPNKGFRLETNQYSADWKDNSNFPYTTASDLRGNPWSHRVTWTSIPDPFNVVTPLILPHYYRGAAAAKEITLDLYVPNTATFYLDELQMIATYVDSSDVMRTESVGGARGLRFGTRTALSAGSATWTPNGIASAHSGKKISLTTSQPIKQNSEVIISLGLCAIRSPSVTFYVSTEPVLTTP
jgi:hypothetical protein